VFSPYDVLQRCSNVGIGAACDLRHGVSITDLIIGWRITFICLVICDLFNDTLWS
jgi:hypothetical protein